MTKGLPSNAAVQKCSRHRWCGLAWATTIKHSRGGRFVVHVMALPGKPHDGHTLRMLLPAIEELVGAPLRRVLTDAGYCGHKLPLPWKFKVFVEGQKRCMTKAVRRFMKRRVAVELVIGHRQAEPRMGRNYLPHRLDNIINAILAAVGCNFRQLARYLAQLLLRLFLNWLPTARCIAPAP